MRLAPLLALATFAAACGQEVVTPPCADHDATVADGALPPGPDARAIDLDAGANDAGEGADAAGLDAAPSDAGAGCRPYCLTALAATSTRVNVRETVTLTPTAMNTTGAPLVYSIRPGELTSTRLPGRPPLVLSQITVEMTVDPATGVVTFRVAEVPPWFIATTFHVRVHAKGPSPNDPEVSAHADVHVRGNIVFSAEYSDVARVYAVASDGRPARATQAGLMRGELITQLAREPTALLTSRDGTLLVLDYGSTPQRLLRFELTGHDQQRTAFEVADAQGQPYLGLGSTYYHSLVELPDGRVVVLDYAFSRTPKSRLVIWNADGTYDRTLTAPDPQAVWTGIGLHSSGDLLLTRLDMGGSVERIQAATGSLVGVFANALPNTPRSVLGLPGGVTYVGGDGYIIRIEGASRSLVNGLPGSTSAYWWQITRFDEGRLLAINDERSEASQPVIIEDRQFAGRVRVTGAGNVSTQLISAAYLE